MALKRMAVETLALIGLALVAGTISNASAASKRKLHWVSQQQVPAAAAAVVPRGGASDGAEVPPATETPVPAAVASGFEVGNERVLAEHAKGTLFLDARRSEVYAQGHIPGARSFPVWEILVDELIVELLAEVPTSATIVTYCSGGKCEDSHLLRGKLLSAGYTDVLVAVEGLPGWEQAGMPVEK